MWIGRRFRATFRWLGALPLWKLLGLLLALMMSPCICCCGGFIVRQQYIHRFVLTDEDRAFTHDTLYLEGVPSAARKLIIEMEPYQTPDDAVAAHPDWFQHRFPNGEWIFGYGIDSHGFKVGHGTLVIKDSRGRTRVFFGHVCGTNAGFPESMRYAKTLDDMEKDGYFASVLREWFP